MRVAWPPGGVPDATGATVLVVGTTGDQKTIVVVANGLVEPEQRHFPKACRSARRFRWRQRRRALPAPNKGRSPGFSDLDQLLAQKGPLGSGTKLRLPDDQLFQYDSDVLQASAITQLQKLGTLIQRNPKATFSVEGYTDSFGTYEYNLDLSQRRADSVKRYLVEAMRINPAQVETRGYGSAKFRASPNGSIEEQSPNRRVEVVVHTSEG